MMDIIDYIGSASGIDSGIYANTDIGTAQKIISIARYLLASNGQSLPGILTWQFNHPLPYEDGITEPIYHDLFEKVGRNESLQQSFFANRCSQLNDRAVLAYDSTTISTYSENQIEARYGFNKAEDGLKTIKLLTLYSIDTRQPIAFTKQPGNLPDVITVENALSQLSVLGLDKALIVTDNGYYSEHNLSEFFQARFDFVTLVKISLRWVKAELDRHIGDFDSVSSACPFDVGTHGISTILMHEFSKVRKYAGKSKGLKKGDTETFSRRIYLHLYFNPLRRVEEDTAFDNDIIGLRKHLEEGMAVDELSERAQEKVHKYLIVKKRGSAVSVTIREDVCLEAKKYHGYFALVSNCESSTFDCLRIYRKRETIESFFEAMKLHTDGSRVRVWNADVLRGRLFVQFIALCYYEYISEEIRTMKNRLGLTNGDKKHDSQQNLLQEKKLKAWLESNPIYLILQWFDTVEETMASTKLRSKRWTSEITSRDRLFLTSLGLKSGA
jgi:transposase